MIFPFSRQGHKRNHFAQCLYVLIALGTPLSKVFVATASNPDQFLSVPDLIEKYGYPAESHNVLTEDGHILRLHRIPYSSKSPAAPNKPAVLLHHGLLSSSADWIVLGPEKSLGYLLADAGYDVWLGNCRGNRYSKNHTTLSNKSKEYWDFSWHEVGIYDIPAMIDYILEQTQQNKLNYVGMSMGCTAFFVMASMKPEYNDRIRLMVSLAGTAYLTHVASPLAKSRMHQEEGLQLLTSLGVYEVFPSAGQIADTVCKDLNTRHMCANFIFFLCGYDPKQFNLDLLPLLLSHAPAGASVKSFLHYQQEARTDKFLMFDYGKENMQKYKRNTPPEYNLKAVTAPIALLYGNNDLLGNPTGRRMIKERNLFGFLIIFAIHCSYLIGLDETSMDNELNPVLSTISSLYQNVKLDNIIPLLLNHSDQPDQYLTTPELIKKCGYPVEIHSVNTADGYVLELHRIPFSSKSPSAENKPVAFLQHGLLSSSADWIILGPEKSLGYLLADAGYDVWMGNARGNTYSKKHTILSASDSKFWDFSWHEMGVYDLPAVLDYILSNTNQKNLYYIGHSMGTTMFFVLTSSMPQYNSKIKLMTSLAPIAFLGHSTSPFPKFLSWNPLTYITVDFLGIKQFLPSGEVMTSLANNWCSDKSITQQVCSTVLFALCGFDDIQLNKVISDVMTTEWYIIVLIMVIFLLPIII